MNDLSSMGIAVGLGFLVGLQRQWSGDPVAGIRTFPLVALFGVISGLLTRNFGMWMAAAGLISCAGLFVMANVMRTRGEEEKDVGLTTEIASLVVFCMGLALAAGYRLEAVITAGVVMVFLQIKRQLHTAVERVGEKDLLEIARLVLAGLIILPLLPNKEMGALGVFNPFKVWLMVVLIAGISLTAYLARKFLGASVGVLLSGLFGGLISSTATTVSTAQGSKAVPKNGGAFAVIALAASAVVFGRVLVEMVVAAPQHWRAMAAPVALLLVWTLAIAAGAWFLQRKEGFTMTAEDDPPSEWKGAVIFALLYVAVLYGVAYAKEKLGESGLYAVAAISGLTDMDAITLSSSGLVAAGHIPPETGWRLVVVGGMANTVLKGAMITVMAAPSMKKPALAGLGAALLGGAAVLFLWPR